MASFEPAEDTADLQRNYLAVRQTLAAAAVDAGRTADALTLIGASKTQPPHVLRAAFDLGLRDFGENYLDEALPKIETLADLDACWHFIGRIQSNKTRRIARLFDWVHTVDREKIARRLSEQCPTDKTLNVLIQVNVDDDPAKGGTKRTDTATLARAIAPLPRLRLRGLMTILSQAQDPAEGYRSMAELSQHIHGRLPESTQRHWGVLSMGMSGDMNAAVAAGATHLRVGTALFGPRG